MAKNPKYADLPGIAYNQRDVYELPGPDEPEPIEHEDESKCVEKLHISATEAFNKFKGKQVISDGVDFSDRISLKPKTGYQFGDWELPEEGVKETPIEKYERLQCEIKELYEEVNDLKEKAKDEEVNSVDVISNVQFLEKQLDSLKLEECLGADLVATLSDPQGTRLNQLVSQIEAFKQTSILTSEPNSNIQSTKIDTSSDAGMLKYQIMYLPEKARMQEAERIATLERRLFKLETVIGTASDKLSQFSQIFKYQGLIAAVQELEAKAALLDRNQLDMMETRLESILDKMRNIAQITATLSQSSNNTEAEPERKILRMYNIMKETETITGILPQTVNRMLALNKIHQQAATFSKSLTRLEELQSQITADLESNKSLLKGVQESFASNLEIIRNNIESLDERIKKLSK